tara:strand:- start:266 stop:1072 length:807 start_codon:yes stop_codon:yes gene_type:complete
LKDSQIKKENLNIIYPTKPSGFSQSEWEARVDLAACYRLTHHFGWTWTVYNHITLRVPNTDTFLINGFGLGYHEITASNLVLIDIEGNKIGNNDLPVNKAGYMIHSAIHEARPNDLHCVMHSHEVNSQSLAASKMKVIPLIQEGCQLYERVGYHDFEGIVLDPSEKKRLISAIGLKNHTLLLRNHGLITAGPSASWAFVRHQVFIRNTEIQLKLMASNEKFNLMSKKVLEHTREQFEGGAAQGGAATRHPEWPYFWRLLDSIDPLWKS